MSSKLKADGWAFKPDALQLSGHGGNKLRHSEIGAVLCPRTDTFGTLPSETAGVVWEMSLDTIPPPSYNVVKPKVWLLGQLELEKGKFYVLR